MPKCKQVAGKKIAKIKRQSSATPKLFSATHESTSTTRSYLETDLNLEGARADQFESDIPGYYYDKEKKNYFKILPNTMSSISSFVTKETVRKQEAEKQRLSDVQRLAGRGHRGSSSMHTLVLKEKSNNHLVNVLKSVQCGQFTCENLSTYVIRQMCYNLQPVVEWTNYCPSQPSLNLDEIQKLELSSKKDKLVSVTSVKSCIAQCIQLMNVKEEMCRSYGGDKKRTLVSVKPSDVVVGPIYKKISSLCWAQLPSLPGQHTILYTTVCPIGYMPSIIYLCNLDAATSESMTVFELNLGFKIVWSTAWNRHQSRFSVGSERKCHLIDVATRRRWTYNTYNSDPLAQMFSPTNCNVMYNGTRAGLILTHDVRSQGRPQAEMRQQHGVGCLRQLRDDNYILASDFSATICTWDQRMRKIVIKYKGLVNSHYQLPFHIDETETVICSTGSDSYTKIWDCRSGEMLQSLPPPYPVSIDSFPITMYSQQWGNIPGNTGLIMAMNNKFKIYS
ncbi:unnamed protein product [Lymnaea stagnalis]|uniref:Uncharacterized protein n=1 Tax=Lymnaea stagnalis TaxID=6523 RepID=A0AAV2HMI0_LYMST